MADQGETDLGCTPDCSCRRATESDGSVTFERDPRNLRPWVELREDGCWHRAVPAKTVLRKIGLTVEEAEEAIQVGGGYCVGKSSGASGLKCNLFRLSRVRLG